MAARPSVTTRALLILSAAFLAGGSGGSPSQSALHPAGPTAAGIAWLWWFICAAVITMVIVMLSRRVPRRSRVRGNNSPLGANLFGRLWYEEVSSLAVWLGLLGGAAAWMLHILSRYAISEWGCASSFHRVRILGVSETEWMLTLLTLALASAAGTAAWSARRSAATVPIGGESGDNSRGPGIDAARAGSMVSSLFTLLILAQSVPVFIFLEGC